MNLEISNSATENDSYDIIIEKMIAKIRRNSMITNIQNDKWEIPKYNKKQINNAGKIITTPNCSQEKRNQALEILNNWRASHAYPLQVIASNLRRTNPNAIVVQRLKRLESITGKIERFPDMNLYRMQDLGGCRVIVDSIDDVYKSIRRYKTSRIRHILKREYDYIQNPKKSGYRSYHMVYQFHSDKKETYNQNMLIEIQFRTRLQHIWATAVEMMGIYTKSNLKSSQGDEDILRFFTLVSSLFAIKENMPACPDTSNWGDELANEIDILDKKHNIISKLQSLNAIAKVVESNLIENNYKNGYYLLVLDIQNETLRVKSFKASQVELATKLYSEVERLVSSLMDVVLVSAKSFDTLQVAYPNYFIDISNFILEIQNVLNTYKTLRIDNNQDM